jgi:hypothetical protein
MIDVVLGSDVLKSGGGVNSRTARFGEEGTRVTEDFKDVLKALKNWGQEKNGDDLLQNLFYNASNIDYNVDISESCFPSSSRPARSDRNPPPLPTDGPSTTLKGQTDLAKDSLTAINQFISLAQIMITSPAFKKLGSDIVLLTRDVLADAAEGVAQGASEVSPSGTLRPGD